MSGEEDLRKSVVSSLKLLLTLQCAGLLLTLTAGVSLLAQLGQFSECLLFSYKGITISPTNFPYSIISDEDTTSLPIPNIWEVLGMNPIRYPK